MKQAFLWALIVGVLCALFITTGCTRVTYKDFSYISILQKKSLTVQPDGTIEFSTDSDPAVALAREITAQSQVIRTLTPTP